MLKLLTVRLLLLASFYNIILFLTGQPLRPKMRFAFMENCRVFLHSRMEDLHSNYKQMDETGRWVYYDGSKAEYAKFNEMGFLECFKRESLVYLAEVPCDSVNDGDLSFTLEMCNRQLNFDNCINLYDEILNPKSKPYADCVIGSMCYKKFNVQYPLRFECSPTFKGYEIIPSMYQVNGEFKSPTILEYLDDFAKRKNSTYYNVTTDDQSKSDEYDPNDFWKRNANGP